MCVRVCVCGALWCVVLWCGGGGGFGGGVGECVCVCVRVR